MNDYTTRPPTDARHADLRAALRVTLALLFSTTGAAMTPPFPVLAAEPAAAIAGPEGALAAGAALQATESARQRAQALLVEALEAARDGRLQEALTAAQEGLTLAPDDPDGLNLLGQILEGLNRPEEARDAYRRSIAADPAYTQPLANLVVLELRAERFEAALGPLEQALALTPEDPRLHAFRGVALRNLGRLQESTDAFERAWDLEPDSGQLALDVSVARDLSGDRDAALAAAERAVELAPDLLTAHLNLARLLAAGRTEEELIRTPAAYRRALEMAPDIPPAWVRLAEAYTRLAMHAEAEQALRRAAELGAGGPEVHMSLGQALHAQGEYEEAAESFGRAAEADPGLGAAWFLRSEALMNLDRPDEALAALERAADAMPDDPGPPLAAAQILLGRGDLEGVEDRLRAALATGRAPGRVQLALGRLRQRQGRTEEAVEALQAAIAVDPTLIEARYLLGQSLVQEGRTEEGRALLAEYQTLLNQQRAQEVARQRENATDRSRVHRVRARVYLAEGRAEEALAQLQAAVELTPEEADVWRLLIEAHVALGQEADAARARERLAELEGG